MHTLRTRAPRTSFWRDAQFDIMRLSLIKVAVRVTELVTKIKISLPTGFAYQHGFSTLAARHRLHNNKQAFSIREEGLGNFSAGNMRQRLLAG
jgi:hypothetical protein